MTDCSHRGFPVSVFVRRIRGEWEVTTTIHAPKDLVDELGDQVIMDVSRLPTNHVEQVRTEAFEQAKRVIDDLVARRTVTPLPAK